MAQGRAAVPRYPSPLLALSLSVLENLRRGAVIIFNRERSLCPTMFPDANAGVTGRSYLERASSVTLPKCIGGVFLCPTL